MLQYIISFVVLCADHTSTMHEYKTRWTYTLAYYLCLYSILIWEIYTVLYYPSSFLTCAVNTIYFGKHGHFYFINNKDKQQTLQITITVFIFILKIQNNGTVVLVVTKQHFNPGRVRIPTITKRC